MEILAELTQLDGVSGNERDISIWLRNYLESRCACVEINKSGSVIAYLNAPDKNKKTILLEAHMDRIGLIVSEICEGGFLKFKALGGVDERTLPASEVYVLGTKRIFGVIGALPPHLKASGAEEGVKIENLMIDTGLTKAELSSRVSVGDPVVLKSAMRPLLGSRVSSGALDNRAGICAVLGAVNQLSGKSLDCNIKLAFTVGEELGLLGARTIDCSDADLCIVVDVTHGQTPDSKDEGTYPLGSGSVICRGPNLDYNITNRVIAFAEQKGLLHTIEVVAGNTGTNAWVIQTLEHGIKCVLFSIPLRYMHTAVETIDTEDIKAVSKLIAECVEGGVLYA